MASLDKIGTHKTTVYTDDKGYICVKYHWTNVFKWNPKTGDIVLDTGGFQTVTTKTRINQAFNQFGINCKVYQKDFAWYVHINGLEHVFVDKIVFTL